jgi:hypothetical protein
VIVHLDQYLLLITIRTPVAPSERFWQIQTTRQFLKIHPTSRSSGLIELEFDDLRWILFIRRRRLFHIHFVLAIAIVEIDSIDEDR